ncbi:MAG: hypothetical protein GF317_17345 [Candidatus Lokiarchaeota archaeon]|nr:hypothetical protein [Candidatus Lokiarchaeota archaeon]MBD3201285.1 hypothetical protein [Candidatus Lokiarchaeota archaeon]
MSEEIVEFRGAPIRMQERDFLLEMEQITGKKFKQIEKSDLSDTMYYILEESSVVNLELNELQISQIPNSIKNLKILEILDLSWNILQELPESIGELINLKK